MIVPMKQLLLLCSAKAREAAVLALRELGCVHVTPEVRDSEGIRQASARVAAAEQALRVLDVAAKAGTFAFKPDASSPVSAWDCDTLLREAEAAPAPDAVASVNRLAEMVTRLRDEVLAAQTQLRRYAPFGEVDPAQVAALAQAGVAVKLFKVPEAEAPTLGAEAYLFNAEGGFAYGAWISPEPLPEVCESVPLPECATATLRKRALAMEVAAEGLVTKLAAAQGVRATIERALHEDGAQKRLAEVSANLRAEGEVAYLSGYLPARAADALLAKATAEGWGVVLDDPAPGDPNVPVLLEPPKGFRSIGMLFKGLGILPGYSEGDCSVPFYLFFSVFFAMLVGDAGYGALMLAGVLAAAAKVWKKPAARPVIIIFTVFCLSTILWGVLSGTYFGIAKAALPACLQQIPTVSWLGDDNNMMFLCFLLGALHISVARLWNALLLAPHLKAIGEIGWMGVTWSMFMIVSGIVVSWFAQPPWAWWFLGGSVVLILIPLLADIKHEGISIGMLPLNVISAMGDIISYVRLFAVGLASIKVAENFNMMALDLDLPFALKAVCVCLILLVGHGLNLAMGALSVLVHAVRLNTLEFSNAKGITWSGVPYIPFKQP